MTIKEIETKLKELEASVKVLAEAMVIIGDSHKAVAERCGIACEYSKTVREISK